MSDQLLRRAICLWLLSCCAAFASEVYGQQVVYVEQPPREHSSIECFPNPNALAVRLEKKGILFDYEFAAALDTALTPPAAQPNDLIYQFNECFGGGMIDDVFALNPLHTHLLTGAVSAASGAQHDEYSFSFGGNLCTGGMCFGTEHAIAIKAPAFASRRAFDFAKRWDRTSTRAVGPVAGRQHNQYLSTGAAANGFVIGTRVNKKALIFVGKDGGRKDYHQDIIRIRDALLSVGYADANIKVLAGPGYTAAAAPCPLVGPGPASSQAFRSDLLAAIPALPTQAGGTKEYFVWIGDHGGRWKFPIGPAEPTELPGVNPAFGMNFIEANAFVDSAFVAALQTERYVYFESLTSVPAVRIFVNGVQIYGGELGGVLLPQDNVFTFTSTQVPPVPVFVGNNIIRIENLSPIGGMISAIALGTGSVPTDGTLSPDDLNASGTVDMTDLQLFLASFGHARGNEPNIDPDYNPNADFDGDLKVTLADYPWIWTTLSTIP